MATRLNWAGRTARRLATRRVDSIVQMMVRDGLMVERGLEEEKEEVNKKAWEEKEDHLRRSYPRYGGV